MKTRTTVTAWDLLNHQGHEITFDSGRGGEHRTGWDTDEYCLWCKTCQNIIGDVVNFRIDASGRKTILNPNRQRKSPFPVY